MKIDDLCDIDKMDKKLSSIMNKYKSLSSELRLTFQMMKINKQKHDAMIENLTVENFPQDFFSYKTFLINNSEKITAIIKELESINITLDSI